MSVSRLIFITTTDLSSDRSRTLARLLDSIEAFRQSGPGIGLHLHLLCQNASDVPTGLPSWVSAAAIPTSLPLSQARNSLLARLRLAENHLVAFPDDDCWYPAATLRRLVGEFERDSRLDLLVTRYSATPRPADAVPARRPSLQDLIAAAASNTMLIRGSLVAALGPFDERLGLGAAFNGGEDTDYALRASRIARRIAYLDAPLVGHRDPHPTLRTRYFPGSLIAIAKHAAKSPAALPALLRKLCAGAYLILTRRLPASDYFVALRSALTASRDRKPS